MQKITEELLRKRSEHNECDICSLEEISLHQEDIGKLENIGNWCRELKILLLHSNLISKIENVGKLKQLEYLNLSINNIEKIENLEGCESLQKLDLTLNFIGELTSIESLRVNIHLQTLFLTGNPCTDYTGYRNYVVATLPQLKCLDGVEILTSERILAMQDYEEVRQEIIIQQTDYQIKFQREREMRKMETDRSCEFEEDETNFWQKKSYNTPETRTEIALKSKRAKERNKPKDEVKTKREIKLYKEDGSPYNINQPKIDFKIDEDIRNSDIILDIAVYKHLDTNFLNVDIQPKYVRVLIKKKIFQLVLFEEVCPDKSSVKRSQASGHLIITMPKLKTSLSSVYQKEEDKVGKLGENKKKESKREYLEVGEKFDLEKLLTLGNKDTLNDTFVDDPEVPPLE